MHTAKASVQRYRRWGALGAVRPVRSANAIINAIACRVLEGGIRERSTSAAGSPAPLAGGPSDRGSGDRNGAVLADRPERPADLSERDLLFRKSRLRLGLEGDIVQ